MDVKMERMTRRSWFYNCISTEQILHNLFINNGSPTQVWCISELIMDVPQDLLDGY